MDSQLQWIFSCSGLSAAVDFQLHRMFSCSGFSAAVDFQLQWIFSCSRFSAAVHFQLQWICSCSGFSAAVDCIKFSSPQNFKLMQSPLQRRHIMEITRMKKMLIKYRHICFTSFCITIFQIIVKNYQNIMIFKQQLEWVEAPSIKIQSRFHCVPTQMKCSFNASSLSSTPTSYHYHDHSHHPSHHYVMGIGE